MTSPALKAFFGANVERISFRPDQLSPDQIREKLANGEFVELADVPDLVWKKTPDRAPGGRDYAQNAGPEHPNHYADIDEPGSDGKTLRDLTLQGKEFMSVEKWRAWYPYLFLVVGASYRSSCLAPPVQRPTMRSCRNTSTRWKLRCGLVDCGRVTGVTTQNEALDNLLCATGAVDAELFRRLKEAYDYDSASTVGWVEGRLRVLALRLDCGESLSLFDPAGRYQLVVTNRTELKQWTIGNFPVVGEMIRI